MKILKEIESPSGATVIVDGQSMLSFGGCCYLGLSKVPELINAGVEALKDFGPTAQMPRHYGFAMSPNSKVEAAAERFFGVESAMYFSTGYLFGLIALSGTSSQYDVIFLDEKVHYSLRDGAMATGKPIFEFKHLDAVDLAKVIKEKLHLGQRPLVATDGMFPTFGSIPPLGEYRSILDKYDGWLIVDESHSFGVIGPTGRGAVEQYGLCRDRVIAGGSLAKAFCAYGGIAIGPRKVIDELWKCPPARGATSGMSCGAAMSAASLEHVREHPEVLMKLRENCKRLKQGLQQLGISVEETDSPVATFVKGNATAMIELQQKLWENGIFVGYTTYIGAGPEGAIRCAVFADHEFEDIDRLIEVLKE